MNAFLFPGQGSQFVGMAKDLYEENEAARSVLDRANTVLELDLTAIMFGCGDDSQAEADKERLTQTQNTQPALFAHSMAVMSALPSSASKPSMVAGHSLGEYSALAAAGAISFEEGLRIVRLRGELMAKAGDIRPGSMAAILGMEDADVEAVCKDASGDGIVQPANFNSPGQIVISGDVEAIDRAVALAQERGARRALKLPVSGAFHSPLMDFARDGLAEGLATLDIRTPSCPVYLNVTAAPTTDPSVIRKRLVEQLTSPVRWAQCLSAMHTDGATKFIEVGAGKVLSGLVKRTLGRGVETMSFSNAADITAR
jgi:[acyl-carrier-protein] S-malonyltransferase